MTASSSHFSRPEYAFALPILTLTIVPAKVADPTGTGLVVSHIEFDSLQFLPPIHSRHGEHSLPIRIREVEY